jgi:hypothetical protein
MAVPVFLMSMVAPNPLPPTQVGAVYVIWHPDVCANALEAPASATTVVANNHRNRVRGPGTGNERDIVNSPGNEITNGSSAFFRSG